MQSYFNQNRLGKKVEVATIHLETRLDSAKKEYRKENRFTL